jgi:uncharacterized membrane protein YtjA (UPF0391 family)
MLKLALSFLALGLISILLGANEVGGVSMETGRTLLFIFLALALITFVGGLVAGNRSVDKI